MLKSESLIMKEEECKIELKGEQLLINTDHEQLLLNYFVKEELNRDCIIQTKDGYFLCHKIVLAASNSFFRQILNTLLDQEEIALVMMLEYSYSELETILSTAYKCELNNPDLKSVFFTECEPLQLNELIKESSKIRNEILSSIRSKHENLNASSLLMEDSLSRELIEIEPFIMKEELPDMETNQQVSDDDLINGDGMEEEEDWQPNKHKNKSKIKKNTRMKRKKKLTGRKKNKESVKSELLDDDNTTGEEAITNGKEVTDSNVINNNKDLNKIKNENDEIKPKKIKKIRVPKSAYPINCNFCGKILKNRCLKSKHDKKCGAQLSKKGPNICHLCGASFKFTSSLNHHLSINCENSCKICGQVFKSRFAQKDHLFYAHGQVVAKRQSPLTKEEVGERFQCDKCDKFYAKKYSLLAHVKKAHEDNNIPFYQCNECGKCMGTERSLTIHMSLHKPPELPCPMCGKLFHNKKYLDRHARQVHTQQADMKFKCEICGRGFAVKRHMEEHRNVHLNLKPYKCRWCERVYQNTANQNAHERTSHREEYLSNMSSGYKRIQVKKNPPIETQ